jgi:hypothetical protein
VHARLAHLAQLVLTVATHVALVSWTDWARPTGSGSGTADRLL